MNYKSLFIGVIAFMGVAASCNAGEKGKYGDIGKVEQHIGNEQTADRC